MRRSLRCSVAILFLICVLLSAALAWARPTTDKQAEQVVKKWLYLDKKPLGAVLGSQVKEIQTFNDSAGGALYYVAYLNPSGFVIVPADDLVEPIIAFVAKGQYDPSTKNPLGALVNEDVPGRLARARELEKRAGAHGVQLAPESAQGQALKKWQRLQDNGANAWDMISTLAGVGEEAPGLDSISDLRVPPLVQSWWGQLDLNGVPVYNYYTPNQYYCGCVATAMAQLMRYYCYPTTGVGTAAFAVTVNVASQTLRLRGGNGAGGAYNWNSMPLDPITVMFEDWPVIDLAESQRQAIGALTYDAGVASHMNYSGTGSSAKMGDATNALLNTFKYSNAKIGHVGGNAIPNDSLYHMINPGLDAAMPSMLGIFLGEAGTVGHAVVVDGYGYNLATIYHHLNEGLDGGGGGAWYNLPDYNSFDTVADCIYNVFTAGSGEIISGRILDADGAPVNEVSVTAIQDGGKTYTATSNLQGIYAFPKVPSASTFTITAAKTGCTFSSQTVTTGTSTDYSFESGNLWGVELQALERLPEISVNTTTLTNIGNWKQNAASQSFEVWNSGVGALNFTISSDVPWLSITPASGASSGEHQPITITYNTANLAGGTYTANIKITDSLARNAPMIIPVSFKQVVDLNTALDCGLTFTTSSDYPWFGQNSAYVAGGAAAQSSRISYDGASWLATTIQGPGTFTFYWKVSSKSGNGFLRMYLDGEPQVGFEISGEVGWQQKTVQIPLGDHEIVWDYSYDDYLGQRSGADCGWVDKVTYTPAPRAPQIAVTPQSFDITSVEGSGIPCQTLEVWNSGDGTINYYLSPDNSILLSFDHMDGICYANGEHDFVKVYIDSGLGPGTYKYGIWVCDENDHSDYQIVPVNITIISKPVLALSVQSLFNVGQAGQNAPTQIFEVWNSGQQSLDYTISIPDNPGWLSCNSTGGTSTGDHNQVSVSYATETLPVGLHTANIVITPLNARNGPQTIAVAVNVVDKLYDLNTALDNQSLLFTTGGDAVFYGQDKTAFFGGSAVQSGPMMGAQSCWLRTSVTGPGTLSFYWKVPATGGLNTLQFSIDDQYQDYLCGYYGAIDWTQKIFTVPEGVHTLKWSYSRDSYAGKVYSGDCGWVDKVRYITPAQTPAIAVSPVSLTNASFLGQNATSQTFEIWSSGGGTLDYNVSASSNVEGMSWFSCSPTQGSSSGEHNTITVIYDTANVRSPGTLNGTITINDPLSNVSLTIPVTLQLKPIDLNVALDNNQLTFTTGGWGSASPLQPVWLGQGRRFFFGGSAAQSLIVDPGAGSWLETTVTGPGALCFYWDVAGGQLNAYIDNVKVAQAGNGFWEYKSLPIPGGSHSFRWELTSPASYAEGSLDKVRFSPNPPIISLSNNSYNVRCPTGQNPQPLKLEIWNSGGELLDYSIYSSAPWVTCTPDKGVSIGSHNNIDINIDSSSISHGSYKGVVLTVVAEGAVNSPQVIYLTVSVDSTLPTGSITINNASKYANNQNVTLNLTAADADDAAETLQMRLSLDGTKWTDWVPFAATVPFKLDYPGGDGAKKVFAQFKDPAGNISTGLMQSSIILDTTEPEGSIAINNGAPFTKAANVTVTPAATDANGVTSVRLSNDNIGFTEFAYGPGITWNLPSGDAGKTVYAQFKDGAGNWSASTTASIILDTIAPFGSVSINNGAATAKSKAVTLSLAATDANGIQRMRLSNDNSNFTESSYSGIAPWTLSGQDGPKTVYARFQDAAGNWSPSYSATIKLDTTLPSVGKLVARPGSQKVKLDWSGFGDNGSGIKTYRLYCSIKGFPDLFPGNLIYTGMPPFTHSHLTNGTTYYYVVQAIDNADNFSAGTEASATPSVLEFLPQLLLDE
jgi:hypothetical protein